MTFGDMPYRRRVIPLVVVYGWQWVWVVDPARAYLVSSLDQQYNQIQSRLLSFHRWSDGRYGLFCLRSGVLWGSFQSASFNIHGRPLFPFLSSTKYVSGTVAIASPMRSLLPNCVPSYIFGVIFAKRSNLVAIYFSFRDFYAVLSEFCYEMPAYGTFGSLPIVEKLTLG